MSSRREFIKTGMAGAVVGLAGCVDPDQSIEDTNGTEPDDNTDGNTGEDTANDTTEGGGNEDDTREPDDGTDDQDTETGPTTITLNNEGFSAWVVEEVEDGNNEDIERQVSNPEIELSEGTRYRFNNNGWSSHPLAFRNSEGEDSLTQDGTGEFEDDEQVNWVDEEEYVEFTVTSALASELSEYYCTVHPQMVGDVQV